MAKSSTTERVGEPLALIAVVGRMGIGKTTFVNNASGSRLKTALNHGVRASNEFELDGQRVVLIDTPGFTRYTSLCGSKEDVMELIENFLAESYPTGTKLTGIVFVHKVGNHFGTSLMNSIGTMEELCEYLTLENLVIMVHQWGGVRPSAEREDLSNPDGFVEAVARRGAKIYHCTGTSEPDLGALRIILRGRSVERNKGVEELRQELQEHKRRARQEENIRKVLEEEKRRARKEADGLRKYIAELQSKLEQDRHGSACLPLDRSSPEFANRLNGALYGQEYERWVQNFQKDDLAWFVDYLDKALDSLDPSSPASRKCLRELRSVCAAHTTLPTSYMIPPHLLTVDSEPFTSGGFGDVYHGTLKGMPVCVKRLRVTTPGDIALFCKEAVTWKTLKHSNILPLLGAMISPYQLVSAFMPAGDLSKYIPKNPDANRLGLLSEIAEGLCYLHSRNVIHGDLKGMNILVDVVDNVPHARIVDFGIAIVTKNPNSIRHPTHQGVHTPRWSAPEILHKHNPSKESDVYSFAMVAIEVLTGDVPFGNKSDWVAISAVLGGDRPSRPAHHSCTDGLWALIQRCWDEDPHSRPEIREVSQTFSSVSTN